MSLEDRVREAVESAVAKLRDEFDGHRQHLIDSVNGIASDEQATWRSHLEGAVDEARRDADREAEARVDAAREQVRKEADDQIASEREKARQTAQDEIAAVRNQAERDLADKIAAAREQAQHDAAEQIKAAHEQAQRDAAEQIKAAHEQAQREAAEQVSAAREQAQREAGEHISAAREQAQRDAAEHVAAANEKVQQAERDAHAKIETVRAQAPASAAAAASGAGGEVVARVLTSVHRITGAESLRAVLEALGNGAKPEAARVALMLIDHDRLSPWVSFGFDSGQEPGEVNVSSAPAVRTAIGDRRVVAMSASEGSTAPTFLRAAPGREVRIFPLVVGGNVVAAVCAEGAVGKAGDPRPCGRRRSKSWSSTRRCASRT